MRYAASEKLEIIRIVEQSHLPVRRTLEKLGVLPGSFYRWVDRYHTGGVEALDDIQSSSCISRPDVPTCHNPSRQTALALLCWGQQKEHDPLASPAKTRPSPDAYDVSTNAIMDTSRERRRNKRWPEALKREIVAATFAPGWSVSIVARQYDVNANQVFGWRRRFSGAVEPSPSAPGLVPVTITPEPEAKPAPAVSDTIEIEVGGDCRIRVGSGFDDRALRRVLDVLRKR